MEVHAVPVMSQRGHLPLPVLQEGHSPEGHEDAEEDCPWVVKQVSHLQTVRVHTETNKHQLSVCLYSDYKLVFSKFFTFAMVQISDMFQALHVLQRGHIR